MPRYVAARVATIIVPARTDVAATAQIGGVEAQPGDDGKGVAGPGINRHPPAASAFAEAHQVARRQGRIQNSSAVKRKRDRPRTIVAAIVKRPVSAAPDVRFAAQPVRRPDRVLDALRRPRRPIRHSVPQNSAIARHYRPVSPLLDATDLFLFLILVLIIFLGPRRRGLRAP